MLFPLIPHAKFPIETGRDVNVIAKDLMGRAKAGKLYGGVTPRPLHAASHMPVVKIKIGDWLKNAAGSTQHHVAMDPFLAYKLNRDFDKDTIEIFAFMQEHYKGVAHPQDVLNMQTRISAREFGGYTRALSGNVQAQTALLNMREADGAINMAAIRAHALPYFGFGKLPPTSFVGSYSTIAFGSTLADSGLKTPEAVARYMNKMSGDLMVPGGEMTAAHISKYASLMRQGNNNSLKRSVALAIELQRNVYQSTITKGGKDLPALVNEFLTIPSDIADTLAGRSDEEAMELAIQKTRNFLNNVLGPNAEGREATELVNQIQSLHS